MEEFLFALTTNITLSMKSGSGSRQEPVGKKVFREHGEIIPMACSVCFHVVPRPSSPVVTLLTMR